MANEGWSISAAAARLLCSESTVRRRLKPDGDLEALNSPGPLRVSDASVAAAQADMLRRMGVSDPDEQDRCTNSQNPDQRVKDLEQKIERLTADLALTRGALEDLTAAHSTLLDTFRRLAEGATPNH